MPTDARALADEIEAPHLPDRIELSPEQLRQFQVNLHRHVEATAIYGFTHWPSYREWTVSEIQSGHTKDLGSNIGIVDVAPR